MASYSGELVLDECEFARNVVQEGSLILAEGSMLELQDLSMIGNNVTTGLVYIGENATLSSTSGGICSLSNSAPKNDTNSSGTCEGIKLEDADNCLALGECETQAPSLSPTAGSAAPSTAPSFVPRACYSTLGSLKSAIELAATQTNERETIRVCAGAVLDGNTEWEHSPIEIKTGSLRFECGTTGSHSENCMIFGGDIQIRIGPGAGRVLFSGFTLVDAKQVSVLAAGSATTEGLFEDCHWKVRFMVRNSHYLQQYTHTIEQMNNGIAGVLVYNEAAAEPYIGQRNLEQLPAPSSPSMSLDFDNCYFEENFFSFAALALVRGHSFLHSTVFRDNKTSRLGTVGVTQGSSLGISASCFIQNQALVDGIIMVDATSNITRNVQNYGEDNESLLGICGSVFDDLSGTCAIDGTCQGNCLPFNANECGVPLSDRTLGPTPPPVVAPTPVPEFPPTVTAEPGSSGDPETGGGGGGSKEEGKGAGSIVMAVILVLIVFAVGFWFWRRGRQKDKAKNKKIKAANKKGKEEEKKRKERKGRDTEKDKKLAAIKNKASKSYDDDEEFYDEDDSYSDDSDQSSQQSAKKKKGWFGFMGGSNHEDKKKKREHRKKVKVERKSKKKEKKKGKGSKSSSKKKKKDDSEIEERSNYESDDASEDAPSEASEVSEKKKGKDEESNDKKSPKKKLFERSSSSGSSVKSAASKKSAKSEEEKMEEGEASSVES